MSRRTRWRRSRIMLLAVLVAAAAAVVTAASLEEGAVYYRTPSEVAGEEVEPGDRIRVGGQVVPRSLHDSGNVVTFRLSDGSGQLSVVHTGLRPPVHQEGQGALVEGVLGADGVFRSDRLMVKHSNEYRAPGEAPATADMEWP